MNNPDSLPCLSFEKVYEKNIENKLKEIDLFLKTTSTPYDLNDVATLLNISINDLECIINENNVSSLNMVGFFIVMQNASSYICRLLQRQWQCSNFESYTADTISYIYELNPEKVKDALKESGLSHITSHNIKELFSYIYVPIMHT